MIWRVWNLSRGRKFTWMRFFRPSSFSIILCNHSSSAFLCLASLARCSSSTFLKACLLVGPFSVTTLLVGPLIVTAFLISTFLLIGPAPFLSAIYDYKPVSLGDPVTPASCASGIFLPCPGNQLLHRPGIWVAMTPGEPEQNLPRESLSLPCTDLSPEEEMECTNTIVKCPWVCEDTDGFECKGWSIDALVD